MGLFMMLASAGCSDVVGDDTAETTTTTTTTADPAPEVVDVTISATGTYPVDPGYDMERIEVPAGAMVNLTLINADGNPTTGHDWVAEGIEGAATETVQPGEQTTIMFQAPDEAGEFPFYCSIGNHRGLGMEGVFAVV